MKQAIYNNYNKTINTTALNTKMIRPADVKSAKPGAGLVRWIARKWDLVGVLALMGASAAYGVYALIHTGL